MNEGDNGQKPEQGHERGLQRPLEDRPDTQDSRDGAQEKPALEQTAVVPPASIAATSGIPPAGPPRSHAKQVWKGIGLHQ
jgi:hypothetical protein